MSEDGPPDRFSALRARAYLEALATEPRPMGTMAHRRARELLLAELRNLGLGPEVQETPVVVGEPDGGVLAATVSNVLGRLPGRGGGKALLLVSHYDSVPNSPGAADDGAGMAAMLETLRVIGRESPRRNDVVFLFTDGEEPGLLGARAFLEHPSIEDVGLVLNFEARGSSGPSFMFETSHGNARLIRTLQRAVDRPLAASFSGDIYRMLPNDTDFSVFRQRGLAGLNFAFIGDSANYHTAWDTVDQLDLRSLQHQGDVMLALTRAFADADLATESHDEALYFDLPGGLGVAYSARWVLPLLVTAAVSLAALGVLGVRRRQIKAGGVVVGGLTATVGAMVVGALLVLFRDFAFSHDAGFRLGNGWSGDALVHLGLACVAVGLTLEIQRLASAWLASTDQALGGLLIWLLLAIVTSLIAPSSSYLFAVPLLAGCAAAAPELLRHRGSGVSDRVPVFELLVQVVAVAVAAAIWVPALKTISAALGDGASIVSGVVITLLLLGLLTPLMAKLRGKPLAPLAIAAGILLVAGVFIAGSGVEARRFDSLAYLADIPSGQTSWVGFDRETDEWTAQFLSANPESEPAPAALGLRRPVLKGPAPSVPLKGAVVTLLKGEAEAQSPLLALKLTWSRAPHRALISLKSDAEIRALTLHGQRVEQPPDMAREASEMSLVYHAPPEDLRIDVELAGGEPLEIEVVDQFYELPEPKDFSYPPRPPHVMPRPDWLSDSTLVRSTERLLPEG